MQECVLQLFKQQKAMTAALCTVRAGTQSLWRSCFSQACVVCMCVAAHSDPPHGWLVGIPASLCNYGFSPGLSALPVRLSSNKARPVPIHVARISPGHLAQALILTITHHWVKMCAGIRGRRELLQEKEAV